MDQRLELGGWVLMGYNLVVFRVSFLSAGRHWAGAFPGQARPRFAEYLVLP